MRILKKYDIILSIEKERLMTNNPIHPQTSHPISGGHHPWIDSNHPTRQQLIDTELYDATSYTLAYLSHKKMDIQDFLVLDAKLGLLDFLIYMSPVFHLQGDIATLAEIDAFIDAGIPFHPPN